MRKLTTYTLFLSLIIFISACQDKTDVTDLSRYSDDEWKVLKEVLDIPEDPYNYNVALPSHFMNSTGQNELVVDADMATLGRVLFYDPILSVNNTVSCASCHTQADAFSDKVAFSDGFDGEKTKRNSFALGTVPNVEVSYGGFSQNLFFWDHRAGSVEEQCEMTISDPIEMGMDLSTLSDKLQQEEHYRILFKKAFKQEDINNDLIFSAIAQFLRSFDNDNTKFDTELMSAGDNVHQTFAGFTARENLGKTLYNNNCASCHGSNHITAGTIVANNGLSLNYTDKGLGDLHSNSEHLNGVFKVPLLRNVALTAPYMHDGSIATLEAVIDHYSNNIANHTNLHHNLKSSGQARQFNFSNDEKLALVAYLQTLTDEEFITAVRYSDPFK